MRSFLCFLLLELLGTLAVSAVELNFAANDPQKQAEMEKYVQQLGNPSWQIREEAGRRILEGGMDALEALQKAMESPDLTTAAAAKYYYASLSHGMTRSSDPPQVQEILANYGTSQSGNLEVITMLSQLPVEECVVPLVRIAELESCDSISLRAAAAVLWELPYPVVLHPVPSILPSEETKKPVDESLLLTQEDLPKTWETRKEYVQKILEHLTQVPSNTSGAVHLKNALESEIAPPNADALLPQIREERNALVRQFTADNTIAMPADASLALLEWSYLRADQLARLATPEQGTSFLQYCQKSLPSQFASSQYNSDLERQNSIIPRLRLVEQLFGRGHWKWGNSEGKILLQSVQSAEAVVIAQILANAMHHSGNHTQAAETLLHSLRSPITRTVLRRYDMSENDFQARARYYLACQAGVENDVEKQKTLLEEILAIDPNEADTLILCWQLAEAGSDDVWKKKTAQRIDDALDVLKKKIEDSSNMDIAQNQNVFAWLAANTNRRLDEALEAARSAVFAEPDNGGIRDTLAHALFAQKKYADAVKEQKQAARLQPNDLQIRRNLWRFEEQLQKSTSDESPH
ncbi:MAG: hypothetical protein Q4D98_09515 [Planctomycetia bacterium]|nr:hypothetical protein [Planctomycetia bacterium]